MKSLSLLLWLTLQIWCIGLLSQNGMSSNKSNLKSIMVLTLQTVRVHDFLVIVKLRNVLLKWPDHPMMLLPISLWPVTSHRLMFWLMTRGKHVLWSIVELLAPWSVQVWLNWWVWKIRSIRLPLASMVWARSQWNLLECSIVYLFNCLMCWSVCVLLLCMKTQHLRWF